MEKNPEKEIMIDPRWSILMDGLGYQVLVVGGMPETDKDGKEVVVFTIKPDDVVRKRYNWRGGMELNEMGNKKLTIAKIDLIPMNMYDDSNKKWLYVKSFNHDETEVSKREKVLKLEINRLNQESSKYEAENLRLSEINELYRTNPEKAMTAGAEFFNKAMQTASSLIKKDDKQNG